MATDSDHPDSLSADAPELTPEGPQPGRRVKIAILAGIPLLVLLLAGGVWAGWSFAGRSSETSSDAEAPAQRSRAPKAGAKEGKRGDKENRAEKSKEDPKRGKEAKKGHAKEEKPGKTEEKKSGAKEEGKQSGKEDKKPKKAEEKGTHAEPKPGKKEEPKHGGKEGKPREAESAGDQQANAAPEERGPAYLGEGKVRLGAFRVKLYDPVTRTLLRIDFLLEGLVDCGDEAAFAAFLKANYHFFREQVMVAVRTCEPVDFADPGLVLLKRRLIARVNRALRQPFLKAAELKSFEVSESIDNSPLVRWQPAVEIR